MTDQMVSKTAKYSVKPEWGDCDPAKIVYYPRYFAWFDNATRHLFDEVGLPWPMLMERYGIIGCPIVDAGAKFTRPSVFADQLTVESHVARWSGRSFKVAHRIMRGDEQVADGHEVRVWARAHPDDITRIEALAIPDEVMAAFQVDQSS